MATEIYLVKVGMSMTEGVVEEWYIPDGERVEVGQLLYRLETEKVNLDVDAEAAGTVKHAVAEGITMEPGDVVGYIFADGEDIPADLSAAAGTPQVRPSQLRAAMHRQRKPPHNQLLNPRAAMAIECWPLPLRAVWHANWAWTTQR